MPADTFSNTLGFLIMGTGNDNNSWGVNANTAVFQIFEDSIANFLSSAVTGGTLDLSGSPPPAAASQARYSALVFTGTLTSAQVVKVPNLTKFWWVKNATSGAFTLKFETPALTLSIPIPQNSGWQLVLCDGNNNIIVDSVNFGVSTSQIQQQDGSAGAPAYSDLNETNSGWYRHGAGDWRLSILGNDVLQVTASAVNALQPLQQNGVPVVSSGRTTVADTNYTVVSTDRLIAYTSLTAARTVSLPAASAFTAGAVLTILDETGNCSTSKTITINRAGSDVIASSAGASGTSFTLNGAFASVQIESNGSNKWTVVNQATLALVDQTAAGGSNVASFSGGTISSGTFTVDCGKSPLQFITNGGAFTLQAPSSDGSCEILVVNNATAGTITFSGFTVGANVGDALTTTNGNQFIITVVRINGVSTYFVKALQ